MKQRFSVMKMTLTYKAGARDPLSKKSNRIIMFILIQKCSHLSIVFGSSRPVGSCLYDIYNQVCFFFRLLLCKRRLTVNSFLTWLVVAWCELSLHDYDCAHNKIFPAAIKRASTEYNKSSHLINTSALSNRMREMDKMQ